jgi:hypothetical protein
MKARIKVSRIRYDLSNFIIAHLDFASFCRLYQVARDMPAASHGLLASIVLALSSRRGRPGLASRGPDATPAAFTRLRFALDTMSVWASPFSDRIAGLLSPPPRELFVAIIGQILAQCRSPHVLHFGASIGQLLDCF